VFAHHLALEPGQGLKQQGYPDAMRREHANAMQTVLKPKTLDEMLEEYEQEMAED
jgi:hypothetical protein